MRTMVRQIRLSRRGRGRQSLSNRRRVSVRGIKKTGDTPGNLVRKEFLQVRKELSWTIRPSDDEKDGHKTVGNALVCENVCRGGTHEKHEECDENCDDPCKSTAHWTPRLSGHMVK